MKVSLVISTYNWKEALGLCLLSVTRQTVIPTEVIIADDGGMFDTKYFFAEATQACKDGEAYQDDECTDVFVNATGSYFYS